MWITFDSYGTTKQKTFLTKVDNFKQTLSILIEFGSLRQKLSNLTLIGKFVRWIQTEPPKFKGPSQFKKLIISYFFHESIFLSVYNNVLKGFSLAEKIGESSDEEFVIDKMHG